MLTNHKQFLSWRWIFDVSLAKLSRNSAEMSSRVSSKEQECASRVVGDICRILCSTINRSVCTLYWNKTISTFWINGAFYYKINSCALVGTPHVLIIWIFHWSSHVRHCETIVNTFQSIAFWRRPQRVEIYRTYLNGFHPCYLTIQYFLLYYCIWRLDCYLP